MSLPDPTPGAVVMVTGASSGIGTELTRHLAALGHDLVLVARRREPLDALAAELRAAHDVAVTVVPADLSDPAQRRRLVATLQASGTFVAGLCNNAAFGSSGRVVELDPARQAEMVQVNVAAMHELTLAFVGPMVARGAGAILNVASIAAFQPAPGMTTYAATKAFVQSFSEALHAELAGTGVSCTVLVPGPAPTDAGEAADVLATADPAEVATAAVRGMLRGRRMVVPGTAPKTRATGGSYLPRSILVGAARRATRGGDR